MSKILRKSFTEQAAVSNVSNQLTHTKERHGEQTPVERGHVCAQRKLLLIPQNNNCLHCEAAVVSCDSSSDEGVSVKAKGTGLSAFIERI